MTMKTRHFYLAVLAAAVLAGCSNDDEMAGTQQNVLPEDGVIRMEANVNGMNTRAVGYSQNGLSELGLFVENANSTTYSYGNVRMNKGTTDTWSSYASDGTTALTMLWQSASASVTVTAYAPYNGTATLESGLTGTVLTDQTSEENSKASDVLFASSPVTPNAPDNKNDIYYDASTKKLKVQMNHALSKLTVNIRYGTELTQDGVTPSLTAITLGNTLTGYSLPLSTGAASATGSTQDIKMALSDATASDYTKMGEAILVPQKSAFTVTVSIGDRTFVYNNSEFTFEKGHAYTLNLIVGKDIVNIGKITASEWTTNDGGSLETE